MAIQNNSNMINLKNLYKSFTSRWESRTYVFQNHSDIKVKLNGNLALDFTCDDDKLTLIVDSSTGFVKSAMHCDLITKKKIILKKDLSNNQDMLKLVNLVSKMFTGYDDTVKTENE